MTIDLAALEAAAPSQFDWSVSVDDLPEHGAARVDVGFRWRDGLGTPVSGAGRIWLPDSLDGAAPVIVAAGYELYESGVSPWLGEGFVVATTVAPDPATVGTGTNPISRGTNLDVSFLHGLRLAPFVDDAHVFVIGGSAGGYMTLMLAAETFPLAGAMPEVPIVNLGYTVAYWLGNHDVAKAPDVDGGPPRMPYLASLITLGNEARALYGDGPESEAFFTHSPVAHVDRITCPVSVCFSTGDNLVPIAQVGAPEAVGVEVLDGRANGITMVAGDLLPVGPGHVRLLDVLAGELVELRTIPVAPGTELRDLDDAEAMARAVVLHLPAGDRRWTVSIIDEGPPGEDVPHYRYNVAPNHDAFRQKHASRPPALDQLDEAKLQLLVDRWSGREWLGPGPAQLDTPDAEQADVARGLRTWCSISPAHAARFFALVASSAEARAAFDADLLRELDGP